MLSYLRKKMKAIMVIVAVVFAGTMFYGLGYMGVKTMEQPKKNSYATVDGKEIDHIRFQQSINKYFSSEKGRITPEKAMFYQSLALREIIEYQLMLNEAKRHVRVSGSELDQTIDQIVTVNKLPNRDALKAALKNMGQDYNRFREQVKEDLYVGKMTNLIKSGVTVTPDDLREVKARHILVMLRGNDEKAEFEARAKAEDILAKIKKGSSFAVMAQEYSDDKTSGAKGGELGYFTTSMMVPDFTKVAFSLKPGQMSDVFRTPYGYHIVLVEDTRLRRPKVKGKDISQEVLAEKQQAAVQNWLLDLRKKSKIEINDPMLKGHTLMFGNLVKEAIASYNQAALEDPSNPYIHLFLAQAYLKDNNKDFAMMEYDKAAQYSGADPSLLISVGDAYIGLKRRPQALDDYRRASMIAGDNKELHEELAGIFTKLGS